MDNLNEEQPFVDIENSKEVSCGDNGIGVEDENDGSSFGKFKSAEALVNAYNNLQAEFTRRCQRIKNLEKQLDGVAVENKEENVCDTTMLNKEQNSKCNQGEEMQEIKREEYDTASNTDASGYTRNYNEEFVNFLSENKDAKNYAKEIEEEILNDKNLSFQSAYDRVLAKKFVAPSELVKDNEFLNNYILSNEEILKNIIKKYKSEEKVLPTIIQNNSNTSIAQAYPVEVNTIKEAGELAKKLLS